MGRLPEEFGLTTWSRSPYDQYDFESSVTTCTPQLRIRARERPSSPSRFATSQDQTE